jgi:hypothetical protein
MKILFINDFQGVDYLNDTIFHGGRSLFGENFVESNDAWYMYDDITPYTKSSLYGMGFTIAGKLNRISIDTTNILEKIKDRFFDLIIYGSVHRNISYFDEVIKSYKSNEIVFLDGEDETYFNEKIIGYGVYFKRELIKERECVLPISFSIPKELININTCKEKVLAMPSSYETGYIFNKENDYYEEYKKSYFALTKKKGGWDCLRHYEILMNGCLPLFHNLHELPKNIMIHWDKNLLQECLNLFWEFRLDEQKYINLKSRVVDNLHNNLTTESMVNYILSKL